MVAHCGLDGHFPKNKESGASFNGLLDISASSLEKCLIKFCLFNWVVFILDCKIFYILRIKVYQIDDSRLFSLILWGVLSRS